MFSLKILTNARNTIKYTTVCRYLSVEHVDSNKETHFGFNTVKESEKAGKGILLFLFNRITKLKYCF